MKWNSLSYRKVGAGDRGRTGDVQLGNLNGDWKIKPIAPTTVIDTYRCPLILLSRFRTRQLSQYEVQYGLQTLIGSLPKGKRRATNPAFPLVVIFAYCQKHCNRTLAR